MAISWRMACRLMRCCPPRSGAGSWKSCQGWVISAIRAFNASSLAPASATGQRPAGRGPAPVFIASAWVTGAWVMSMAVVADSAYAVSAAL